MSRIVFDDSGPIAESHPARTDIACFVGLARATGAALPSNSPILGWLQAHGWGSGPAARSMVPPYTDIPLPIESYATFTALFDPGGSAASSGTDYMAAAVRSFFAQGGRRCYVVRMDDPLAPGDDQARNGLTGKARKLASLMPGDLYAADDPRSWHGAGHLGGLPDVSFLALPDLPALCASAPIAAVGGTPIVSSGPAQFVECATPATAPAASRVYPLPAPRLSPNDYANNWLPGVSAVLGYLYASNIREIQFVVAFPLPQDLDSAATIENPSSAALAQDIHNVIATSMPEWPTADLTWQPDNSMFGVSTAFLQLAYPWLKTSGSGVLNESLEPPDGALVGILARNALTRGAFTDATKIVPAEIFDVWPPLPAPDLQVPSTPYTWGDGSVKPLVLRLSLFGFTPAGLRLLSDVTSYPGESYRPACVHRLVSVISRASRQLGEQITFSQNGPALWQRVETTLGQLMTQLWLANALDGDTIQDAFSVRCDASTITQNDLDNGRLLAQVTFNAAATIELIRITLALETSGAAAQGTAVLEVG